MAKRDPPPRPCMIPYGILMGLTLLPGLLLSIGLPNIPGMFIARVQVDPYGGKDLAHGVDELRFGVWSFCQNRMDLSLGRCPPYAQCKRGYNDATAMIYECIPKRNGYEVTIQPINESNNQVTIPKAKSVALAVHPAATIFTLIAIFIPWQRWIASGIAFVLTLAAFVADLHLYQFVNAQMRKLGDAGVVQKTTSGPGVWLTLTIAIFIFIEFAQCVVEELIRYYRQKSGNEVGLAQGNLENGRRGSDTSLAEIRQHETGASTTLGTRRSSYAALRQHPCEQCHRIFNNAPDLVEHRLSAHRPVGSRRPALPRESSGRTYNSSASGSGTARTASTLAVTPIGTPKIEEEVGPEAPDEFGVQMIPMSRPASQIQPQHQVENDQRRGRHAAAAGTARRTNTGGTKVCSFCMRTDDLGTLPCCGGVFCFECISGVVSTNSKCPTCKNPTSMADFNRDGATRSGRRR